MYDYTRMLAELTEHYGRRPLASITSADVRAWYNGLDPAKPTKRANLYVLLKTVLKAAVADELIPVCPANIRGASAVKRAHKVKPATPEEIGAIVAAMPPRWALMVQLAVYCGLRFGEIAELRRGDVDLAAVLHTLDDDGAPVTVPAPVVRVSRGVQWIKGRPAVSSTKTAAGVRTVAVPSGLVPAIAAHLDVYASPEPDGLLFTAARNPSAYVAHGTVSQAFQRARKAAGRPDLRFHDLRHTGASMMSETGASVRELAAWLGHSTAEMALYYCHASPARMRRNADALPAPAAERINR